MLSDRDIELAHPDAFDFVWGNLPAAKRAEFNRHLSSCPYCQAVVDEYREIGQIIKLLPPHAEPAADLEDRTVAAMVAALAEQPSATDRRADAADQAATRVYPIPRPSLLLSPRPRSTRGPSSRLRLRTSPGSTRSPRPSPRPIRRPSRRSLACLCGAVTLAGLLLS